MNDPDIGRCDFCGGEDGPRRKTWRRTTLGEAWRVWLCPECRTVELRRQAS